MRATRAVTDDERQRQSVPLTYSRRYLGRLLVVAWVVGVGVPKQAPHIKDQDTSADVGKDEASGLSGGSHETDGGEILGDGMRDPDYGPGKDLCVELDYWDGIPQDQIDS